MFIIRPFQSKDMFAVIKLASQLLTEEYSPTLFTYFYETSPWSFFVAEEHHKIIGFGIGIQQTTETARIVMIGTDETYQNRGIGSAVLYHLLYAFVQRNISFVELEVKTTNNQAIQFYEKHQFKILDTIPDFYQNGESAYIMRRRCFPHKGD